MPDSGIEQGRDRSIWARLRYRIERWGYVSEDGRDLRIDLLRGLAAVAMIVDHIAGPSKLYLITCGNHFYTSAAEGIIFLSGLTVGLVYRRMWTLYVLAVGLTLVMLPFSEMLLLPWAVGIEETTPLADRLGDLFALPDVLPRRRPGAVRPVDTYCTPRAVFAL